MPGIVVVGAGHAGVAAAAALRREGYDAAITLLGDEPDAPYQRPPLSKAFLLGTADEDALALRSPGFYADNAITVRSGHRVTAIDPQRRTVVLDGGEQVPYTDLVLATGAAARSLQIPGADLAGVVSLRSLSDARALRSVIGSATAVVVIGGGFVGLEVAAALAGRSVQVTVLDVAARLLGRAVTVPVSDHVASVHRDRGVRVVLGTGVATILGRDGRTTGVVDTAGRRHEADLVLVGVGATPRTGLAEATGLAVADGVVVDGSLRTSDRHIYAVGDCACAGGVRLESVQNATDQGTHVARVLTGRRPGDYADLPWFWSDQQGLRLQMAGLVRRDDELQVVGDPGSGRFSVLAFHAGRLAAVESVNRPADHMAARRILSTGVVVTRAAAQLPGFALRDVAKPSVAAAVG
ncbi:pyridine nucleotide-disulfide oxidoreductase [Acrocarpospora pleiomorpha]|uniref:Pyridine nucleotide-disulfide oxidoreductase n=1 Tax=Acrocarpospora pleiomorpha TaxID=90975 RepID=A0A5M3XXB1_9ACTN|nr:FAD-dependent oxidoreductase [Acrocarpospora pleiomorpha]GES24699.1 pyridine nucleotide-disulfide oxidoreductase [Acrocarpospora pleiomorpha]